MVAFYPLPQHDLGGSALGGYPPSLMEGVMHGSRLHLTPPSSALSLRVLFLMTSLSVLWQRLRACNAFQTPLAMSSIELFSSPTHYSFSRSSLFSAYWSCGLCPTAALLFSLVFLERSILFPSFFFAFFGLSGFFWTGSHALRIHTPIFLLSGVVDSATPETA